MNIWLYTLSINIFITCSTNELYAHMCGVAKFRWLYLWICETYNYTVEHGRRYEWKKILKNKFYWNYFMIFKKKWIALVFVDIFDCVERFQTVQRNTGSFRMSVKRSISVEICFNQTKVPVFRKTVSKTTWTRCKFVLFGVEI